MEQLLNRKGIDLTIRDGIGDTPLHEACLHCREKIVVALLGKVEEKQTVIVIKNDIGLTPFHIACREGCHNIVQLLLNFSKPSSHKSLVEDCDKEEATPLHYACQNDDVCTVDLLLKENPDMLLKPKNDGVTPVHIAARYGCKEVMNRFLETRASAVNVLDKYNQTPLHFATEFGQTDMMKLLLEKYIIIDCY